MKQCCPLNRWWLIIIVHAFIVSILSQEWHTFIVESKRKTGDKIGNESIRNQYQLFHLFFFFFLTSSLFRVHFLVHASSNNKHKSTHVFRTMKYSNTKCQNAIQLYYMNGVCSGFVSCHLFLVHQERIFRKQCQQSKRMMAEFLHIAY